MTGAPMQLREPHSVRALGRAQILRTMDRCTKCGICQMYCPVAAVTDRFPGPKYAGPQAQRFRVIEPTTEIAPALCSGCGVCSSVCPNDVAIADIITIARADMVGGDSNLPLLQRILNRPDTIGRIAGKMPALANAVLRSHLLRVLAEYIFGLDRMAPLPRVQGPVFRRWLAAQKQPHGPLAIYFTGCAVESFDAHVGIALVRVLNTLGIHVKAPTDACCSLPMLSSGEWRAAAKRAETLVSAIAGAADRGTPVVSTSTSCGLTLRSKYAAYLDMTDELPQRVAGAVVDVCEFLIGRHAEALQSRLGPLHARILYHGPCQLRGHSMGQPALELLRLIPGLEVHVSQASCCGVAGTYGYSREKARIARVVGRTLVDQAAELRPDVIVCDSETCRWNIEQATGRPSRHPVEVIDAALHGDDPIAGCGPGIWS